VVRLLGQQYVLVAFDYIYIAKRKHLARHRLTTKFFGMIILVIFEENWLPKTAKISG